MVWVAGFGSLILDGSEVRFSTPYDHNDDSYFPYMKYASVKNVTFIGKMDYLFAHNDLENIDFEGANTSQVTSMKGLFSQVSSNGDLETLDISSFNTSNVTNMDEMFDHCYARVIYVGNGWNTSNVESASDMFNACTVADYSPYSGDGNNWSSGEDDILYAKIDEGPSSPGFFTRKE